MAGLSLLLLLATAAMSVRSLRVVDTLDCDANWHSTANMRGSGIGVGSWNGHVEIQVEYRRIGPKGDAVISTDADRFRWSHSLLQAYSWHENYPDWSWGGFCLARATTYVVDGVILFDRPDLVTKIFGIPDWIVIGITSLLPAFWLARFIKHRRRDGAGHCAKCGYDLRATPDRCPGN